MDFSQFKPGQRQTVTTLDRPLFVAAGAGSGKTFTLTQRVVWALTPGSGEGGRPYLDSLDQALIITFTNAAALEIKERVRGALRSQGLTEAALQVDSAWISTIHGMCSRILHDHALDLGLDPEFKLVADVLAAEMMETATECAIRDLQDDQDVRRLLAAHPARGGASGGGDSASSAAGMAQALAGAALACPGGFDSLVWVGRRPDVTSLVNSLKISYEALHATRASKVEAGEELAGWINDIDLWLASVAPASRDAAALIDLLSGIGRPNGNKWRRAEQRDLCREATACWAEASCEAALATEHELREPLTKLARRIVEHYDEAKAKEGALDNDDLMLKTFEAFEAHPEIAREYAEKFRLVMVDEFQDTSEQQVKMIKMLSGPDACHLTTVGDAQQSIYRFRGADVSVFRRRGADMPDELKPTMADNFRSHDDVLRLVARVCGAQGMIPDFMDLAAGRDESKVKYAAADEPRVFVELARAFKDGRRCVGSDCRSRVAAEQVADRLAWLANEKGVRPGDMALLLGRMKNTAMYVDALRDRGVGCVVTGGSTFSSAPEVRTMSLLLTSLANPHDTGALFQVLASPMFGLDANDLVLLGSRKQDTLDAPCKRPIERGMLDRELYGGHEPSVRLSRAFEVMSRAWSSMGGRPCADVLLDVARESGWLARLEAAGPEGQARAANVLAAVRHVRELCEDLSLGVARAATEFALWLDVAKAAPASLMGGDANVVRVMTVHASKGLEFPVVAVAECMGDPAVPASKKSCLTVADGDRVLASLRSKDFSTAKDMVVPDEVNEGSSLVDWRLYLEERDNAEEAAEKVRLLYVALTRAREALVVSFSTQVEKNGLSPVLAGQVYRALFGDEVVEAGLSEFDYGGSRPGVVRCLELQPSVDEATGEKVVEVEAAGSMDVTRLAAASQDRDGQAPAPSFSLYESRDPELGPARPARARTGVYSYSAVMATANGEAVPDDLPTTTSFSAAVGDLGRAGDQEVLRAAAHADNPDDDQPRATSLGSAFHELAQLMAETGSYPDEATVGNVARAWGCSRAQRERLDVALRRWWGSDVRAEAIAHDVVVPEAPFFCERPAQLGEYVDGAIDLLCYDRGSDRALVVDYKTGDADRDADSLRRAHELQARIYADVLLGRGSSHVECAFVCVERDDGHGGPVVVRYAFDEAPGIKN